MIKKLALWLVLLSAAAFAAVEGTQAFLSARTQPDVVEVEVQLEARGETQTVTLENTGNVDALVWFTVSAAEPMTDYVTFTPGEGLTRVDGTNTFLCTEAVAAGKTSSCDVTLQLDTAVDYLHGDGRYYLVISGETTPLGPLEVTVDAVAVQASSFEDARAAYNAYTGVNPEVRITKDDLRKLVTTLPDGTDITAKVTGIVFSQPKYYKDEIKVDSPQTSGANYTAYYLKNAETETYTVYILSENTIYAPEDCSGLFKDMTALTEAALDNFNTDEVTDTSGMYDGTQVTAG